MCGFLSSLPGASPTRTTGGKRDYRSPPAPFARRSESVTNLFPTIVDLVDAPAPLDHPVDGQNLTRLLTGQSDPKHRNEFLNHYPHPRRGQSHFFTTWRKGDWKVRYAYLAEGDERYALYDLAKDPSESRNLATEYPEQLTSMMQGMVHELESMQAVYPMQVRHPLEPVIPRH